MYEFSVKYDLDFCRIFTAKFEYFMQKIMFLVKSTSDEPPVLSGIATQ